jgi:FtsH-binding integral membrane protein
MSLFIVYSALSGSKFKLYIVDLYNANHCFNFSYHSRNVWRNGHCRLYNELDLTKFASILFMALIGLIIAIVVNLFMKSSGLEWIISCAGVLIFTGLTAWMCNE